MSREERRHYQRMMRRTTTQPSLPPQLRGRRQPGRPGRGAPGAGAQASPPGFTVRFWIWTLVLAAGVGLVFLSLAWPQGVPAAVYWGVGAGLAALVVTVGLRLYRRWRPPAG
jgi:hypothetical protein